MHERPNRRKCSDRAVSNLCRVWHVYKLHPCRLTRSIALLSPYFDTSALVSSPHPSCRSLIAGFFPLDTQTHIPIPLLGRRQGSTVSQQVSLYRHPWGHALRHEPLLAYPFVRRQRKPCVTANKQIPPPQTIQPCRRSFLICSSDPGKENLPVYDRSGHLGDEEPWFRCSI